MTGARLVPTCCLTGTRLVPTRCLTGPLERSHGKCGQQIYIKLSLWISISTQILLYLPDASVRLQRKRSEIGRISTEKVGFRRIVQRFPSNFDGFCNVRRNYCSYQFRPSVLIRSSFFMDLSKSPSTRNCCSAVFPCGSTSFKYSYILSRFMANDRFLRSRYIRTDVQP